MPELPPDVKAQLEEQKKQCIFCKLINGEIKAHTVYEDKFMLGILDINPAVKGHTIIVPREHYPIMPFLPPEEFKHIFSTMPKLIGALKKAMLCTGSNIFIANGGVAGQQAPHFLVHVFPREKGDCFDKFSLDKGMQVDETKKVQANAILKKNLPIMMQNHLTKNPPAAQQAKDKNIRPDFIKSATEGADVLYEDEKVICIASKKPQCIGHCEILSKEEEKLIENLDAKSSSHMFFVASFCATAVFEGMGAQGTNIILKSGVSDDNPEERLSIQVIPRYPNDGIDVLWQPTPSKEDLGAVAASIKDKTFIIEHEMKEKKEDKVINLDAKETVEIIPPKAARNSEPATGTQQCPKSSKDEIMDAIRSVWGN